MKLSDICFEWHLANKVSKVLIQECVDLFSAHYGIWGKTAPYGLTPGERVRLSPKRMSALLTGPDTWLALARHEDYLVGYAVAVQAIVPDKGILSWVSQLVVHSKYQGMGIAKNLLASVYGFSDHFSWGLVTANPKAVRALEKATRRRVDPSMVYTHSDLLRAFAKEHVPYVGEGIFRCDETRSVVDTSFHLDLDELDSLIMATSDVSKEPWKLGELEAGEEWIAFTFNEQKPFPITCSDLDILLQHSEQKLWQAFERMTLDDNHRWMKFAAEEVKYLMETYEICPGSRILDLGCGTGRHSLEMARMGMDVIGVDFITMFIQKAKERAAIQKLHSCSFYIGDVRNLDFDHTRFDVVLALYDVVGSFASEEENMAILRTIVNRLTPGGLAVISVMNMHRTEHNALFRASLRDNPEELFRLPPSSTMESSGNVFDPRYYLVDSYSGVVYRREQFSRGEQLPTEIIVRDKRYTRESIASLVRESGLEILNVRYVRAGQFDKEIDPVKAKEILVIARSPVIKNV
ncbi:MAG: GNAT family N-acetyltransferase [Candidatus Edwardsbacteria bacterium]|nr:GNAT family N-acetyltransferase [Candidatus Edwardsbacteria bacterium]MBU1576625.1 GNAT family N-acetyltransferase [Candidatus Edwardsbacteria bacterium]MBU2594968.1 GNAT family N-acetyltransferase [Candidatus Edwardsbacteria bacterium]